MNRDNDYIRELLLEAEADDTIHLLAPLYLSGPEGSEKRHLHAELLSDAGLFIPVNEGVYRMTNQGYDYLEAIRDDTIWKKVKQGAESAGGATLLMLKDIGVAYLKQRVKTSLGIDL